MIICSEAVVQFGKVKYWQCFVAHGNGWVKRCAVKALKCNAGVKLSHALAKSGLGKQRHKPQT